MPFVNVHAAYVHACPCTVLTYGYTSADGKVTSRSIWLDGTMNSREISMFMDAMLSAQQKEDFFGNKAAGVYFVPEQLKIRAIQCDIERGDEEIAPPDHPFHKVLAIEAFHRVPQDCYPDRLQRSIEDFMAEMLAVAEWDLTLSQVYASQVTPAIQTPSELVVHDDAFDAVPA